MVKASRINLFDSFWGPRGKYLFKKKINRHFIPAIQNSTHASGSREKSTSSVVVHKEDENGQSGFMLYAIF